MMEAPALQRWDTKKAGGRKLEKLLIFGTAERELLEKQIEPARLQTHNFYSCSVFLKQPHSSLFSQKTEVFEN